MKESAATPARGAIGQAAWRALLLLAAFTAGACILAGLPRVPYNVRELFSVAPRALSAARIGAALLLLASAPALLARCGWERVWMQPLVWISSGAAAFLLLRGAVPRETLEDPVGSPVLGWPGDLEVLVRFVALAAIPQILLFLAHRTLDGLAQWTRKRQGHAPAAPASAIRLTVAVAVALVCLVLARTVVVPFACTDNITELLGNEFALGALLLLVALNSAALARSRRGGVSVAILGLTALLTLPGWWLSRHGFAQEIHKYGKVFSAQQFLLSPDRENYITGAALLWRWSLAQFAGVLLLALAQRPALARGSASAGEEPWPDRRFWRRCALGWAIFAVYGSLVPLQFEPRPLAEAWGSFLQVAWLRLGIASRADLVANVLLFVPLGYCAAGGWLGERRGRQVAGFPLVAGGCTLLAVAIEFTQQFFPPRTVGLNDIVAESAGGVAGFLLWCAAGPALARWLRAFAAEREPPRVLVRLLAAYAVLFFVAQMLPLDLAISPWDLAEKWRAGRIRLLPFSGSWGSRFEALWDMGGDMLLWMPVGALCALGWTRGGGRRPLVHSVALGIAAVFLVEVAQLCVWSRYSEVTDLITGSAGILLGIAASARVARLEAAPGRIPWVSALLACLWALALVVLYWWPFDFVFDRAHAKAGIPRLLDVPFKTYYFRTEFGATTMFMRKFLLVAPFGALMRLALPREGRWQGWAIAFLAGALHFGIEAGQIFLPGKVPDATDALIGAGGAALGAFVAARLRPAAKSLPPAPPGQ